MLRTRVITAVVALLVIGVVLFVIPERLAEAFIGLIIVAGAWEWSAFLNEPPRAQRYAFTVLVAILGAALYFLASANPEPIFKMAVAWWLGAFIWTFFYPTPIPLLARGLCGVVVLVPLFMALVELYRLGPTYLLAALLIVWAADAGAYFAGKGFGRVKLAPQISPGKTWEGVIGGLLVVLLLSILVAIWSERPISVAVPFCLAIAALSVVGDLTVSMFKRTAGLKDSGSFFPGHGGVLDRIDSVAAAAPLFALGLGWLGLT